MISFFRKKAEKPKTYDPIPFKCSGCGSVDCYMSNTVFDVAICSRCGLLFQSWRNAEYARGKQ